MNSFNDMECAYNIILRDKGKIKNCLLNMAMSSSPNYLAKQKYFIFFK